MKKILLKSFKILTGIIIITIGLLTISFNNDSKLFEISKNIEIFTSTIKELDLNYVDEIQPGKLIKSAIEGMLNDLDPYTVYIPEAEIEDYKFMTTGQYGGIGAIIHKRGEYTQISEIYKDYPADKNGLIPGDITNTTLDVTDNMDKNSFS